ncbi:MAG: FimV/HubP family polar landmark protein [Sideroxyarcus sp.]|nr:FimV/HubP family polar landmark protein [Sideroxyarcus sp.]
MKLFVHEIWDDQGSYCYIEDKETDTQVVDIDFASKSEAQAYLDTHREEIERKGLPPLSHEDVALYWKTVDMVEKQLDAGDLWIESHLGTARKFLLRLVRQSGPLEEASRRRIESVIARLDIATDNARVEASKSALDAQETERKLDLARAYLELGDRDAALIVLDEIVQQGSDEYKDRARKVIGKISGQAN